MSIFLRVLLALISVTVYVFSEFVQRNSSISAKGCRENSIPSFSVQHGQHLLHIAESFPKFIQVERLKNITDQFSDLYISFDLFDRELCPLDSWVPWFRFLSFFPQWTKNYFTRVKWILLLKSEHLLNF